MVRKVNKSLKDWVTFVKKVKAEEGCSYPDAIKRAKVRKDKGEKWMSGGGVADSASQIKPPGTPDNVENPPADVLANKQDISKEIVANPGGASSSTSTVLGVRGGSKKQKTAKKQQKSAKKQKGGRRKTCSKK